MRLTYLLPVLLLALAATGCTGSSTEIGAPLWSFAPSADSFSQLALPADSVQPWEQIDSRGFIIPGIGKGTSAFGQDSYFVPGVERFTEVGNVTDNDETSVVVAGSHSLSGGIYRFPMGGVQPGAWAVDVNLHQVAGNLSRFWVGTSNYDRNSWDWHGPYDDGQITKVVVAGSNSLSTTSTFFLAVVADGEAAFDIVGVSVSPVDDMNTIAPPAPSAPTVASIADALEVSWPEVIAGDLAGYQVYWSYSPFSTAENNGVNRLPWLENTTRMVLPVKFDRDVYVALSAVDVNGNESPMSPAVRKRALRADSDVTAVVTVNTASALRGELVILTASGADLYDFDLDGDGSFDVTGSATGSATVETSSTGIIRPRVRGTSADGRAVAFGSVSLIVSGNQRPVASASANPDEGFSPLQTTLTATFEDFDGAVTELAWDTDGDGIFNVTNPPGTPTQDVTYNETGIYNVKLRVTDDQGAWDVDTITVQVLPAEAELSANPAAAPRGTRIDLEFRLPAGASNIEWDLDGDGSFESATGSTQTTFTSFALPGRYLLQARGSVDGAVVTGTVNVTVQGWAHASPLVDDSPAHDVNTNSLALINGNPAIAYHDTDNGVLLYVRALDVEGKAWGTPLQLTVDFSGSFPKLVEVHNAPAIAYRVLGGYAYIRANDANGTQWGSEVYLADSPGSLWTAALMVGANGSPQFAFYNASQSLSFMHSTDANGDSWSTPVIVDGASGAGAFCAAALVAGHPAVAYYSQAQGDLNYKRAADPNGDSWTSPVLLANNGDVGGYPSLAVVNGLPAVAYVDITVGSEVWYVQALNALGTQWRDEVAVATEASNSRPSLANISGVPFISFEKSDSQSDVYVAKGLDLQGSFWITEPIQQLSVLASIAEINGAPAMSFPVVNGVTGDRALGYARLY